MSIETYATAVIYLYIGLFLFFILIGVVEIWNRIRKKALKHWWGIIPCSIFYLISATISTFVAYVAYDDISHPNYTRYENWTLYDFILHDIKTFIIWLVIGVLLYFIFGRKSTKKTIKTGCVILLGLFVVLLVAIILLSFYVNQKTRILPFPFGYRL